MARNSIHCENLGACETCNHCLERSHPWYYCAYGNDNFGNISNPKDCEEHEYLEDEDCDYVEDNFDPNKPIECPICGNNAYWEGSCYECEQCDWWGLPDD